MKEKKNQPDAVVRTQLKADPLNRIGLKVTVADTGINLPAANSHIPEVTAAMVRAKIERCTELFFIELNVISAENQNLKWKLTRFIALFETATTEGHLQPLYSMLASSVRQPGEESQQMLNRFFSRMERWLCREIGKEQEAFIVSLSTPQLARIIVSGLEGALLIDHSIGTSHRFRAQKRQILSLLAA